MTSAIIVAAGKGTRMGPNTDKLFLELNGCPVIGHTWRRFELCGGIDEIVLVIREGLQQAFTELASQLGLRKPFRLTPGGKERQDSVWNGLAAVSKDTRIVAIHDGARPCTPEATIRATVQAAEQFGAAVTAQQVTDTIKESDKGSFVLRTLDRARLWSVQTPQCFKLDIIRAALTEARRRGLVFTDDTAACELQGQPVKLVPSLEPNPKITRPEDLPIVEVLLNNLDSVGRNSRG